MNKQKEARPDVRASERAVETGAASRQATTSKSNDTTGSPLGQVVHIADFLSYGPENGQKIGDLERLTGWTSREIRKQIERERRDGTQILSDNKNGYFMASDPAEVARFTRSMRHRAHRILEVVRAVERGAGIG